MPPGQTPHTVVLYAHHDLVDSVQPGDRWVKKSTYTLYCLTLHTHNYTTFVFDFLSLVLSNFLPAKPPGSL